MNSYKLTATRTHHTTKQERLVDVTLEIKPYPELDGLWISITEGGVTGYESMRYTKGNMAKGWKACMGTEGRWDSLSISVEELSKIPIPEAE